LDALQGSDIIVFHYFDWDVEVVTVGDRGTVEMHEVEVDKKNFRVKPYSLVTIDMSISIPKNEESQLLVHDELATTSDVTLGSHPQIQDVLSNSRTRGVHNVPTTEEELNKIICAFIPM
jgi:hypothetical protein